MRAAAVIPAGGAGVRMGGAKRKQYLELAGVPVLLRAVQPFLDHAAFEWVVVALPPSELARPPVALPATVRVVAGGDSRGDSVRAALAAVPAEADVVFIHDAARPLLDQSVLDRVVAAAGEGRSVIAAVPVADTLKRVGEAGAIEATVERRAMWAAQTPQAFPRAVIEDAYTRAAADGIEATDDAGLVEHYGGRVYVVEGSPRNLKITGRQDLALAEALLSRRDRRIEAGEGETP